MHTLAHTDWMFPYGNNEVYKGAVTDGGSAAFSSLWRGCKQTNDGSTHDPPTNTHTHTHTHAYTQHLHYGIVSKLHLLLFSRLFTRDAAEGDMNFLSSSSCLHVRLVCLSPCVCSSDSERLVLGLSEYDEKRCQRVKMMLKKKKKQDREGRDWREEKRSYQSFSLTADGLREAEDTKASLWWSWLTLCATATVCCAIFLDKQKSGVDQLLPRHHCCLQHVQITRNFLSI